MFARTRTDPRAATSIVIACMTLALALMVTLTLTPPVRPRRRNRPEQVAPPPAAGKVTIVAATPRLDVPCADQTWPYIERRCLTESTQKRPLPDGRARDAAASTGARSSRKRPRRRLPQSRSPPAAETQGVVTPAKPQRPGCNTRRSSTPAKRPNWPRMGSFRIRSRFVAARSSSVLSSSSAGVPRRSGACGSNGIRRSFPGSSDPHPPVPAG